MTHPMARQMTEGELSRLVVDLAVKSGWRVYGIQDTRRGRLRHHTGAGWPDLVLFRPGMMLFAELKSYGGKLSLEQEEWLRVLRSTFRQVHVWTPEHWYDGTIIDVLVTPPFTVPDEAPPPPLEPLIA